MHPADGSEKPAKEFSEIAIDETLAASRGPDPVNIEAVAHAIQSDQIYSPHRTQILLLGTIPPA